MNLNEIILIEERSELNELLTTTNEEQTSQSVSHLIHEISQKKQSKTHLQLIQTRRFFIIAAIFFGILLSITTTKYSGKDPINVFYYLIVFVIVPLISFLVSRSKSISRLIFGQKKPNETLAKFTGQYHRNSLCLAGCILTLTGSLSLVLIGLFTDLHFSWSTTYPALDSSQIYRFFSFLELPWKWLTGFSWLNQELIESSQYSHLKSEFFGKALQSSQGSWVGFLTTTTFVYSVVPRAIYLVFVFFAFRKQCREYKLSTSKQVYYQNTLHPQKNHAEVTPFQTIHMSDLTHPYFVYYTDEDIKSWLANQKLHEENRLSNPCHTNKKQPNHWPHKKPKRSLGHHVKT